MIKKLLVLTLLAVYNQTFATIFSPLPFDRQVEEATSGTEARLSSSRVFKNADGAIMTEYSFDVLEAYNLSNDDLENKQLKLVMPGGTYDGVTSMIDGAPQFKVGEKAFLLLKKIESKIYLSNFTLGKFKIQNYQGKTYYVSEVFPMDPNIGRISKEKMLDLMKTKWKVSFEEKKDSEEISKAVIVRIPPGPNKEDKLEKRGPAQEEASKEDVPLFFWSALFVVAFFFAFIFFKLSQSEHQHKRE